MLELILIAVLAGCVVQLSIRLGRLEDKFTKMSKFHGIEQLFED